MGGVEERWTVEHLLFALSISAKRFGAPARTTAHGNAKVPLPFAVVMFQRSSLFPTHKCGRSSASHNLSPAIDMFFEFALVAVPANLSGRRLKSQCNEPAKVDVFESPLSMSAVSRGMNHIAGQDIPIDNGQLVIQLSGLKYIHFETRDTDYCPSRTADFCHKTAD
ncbi:hypothetical protein Vi05172_g13614 [Venturia inaequalis]|nr:hypothetical protein Vi05172_g13614 [Venturia inaequalis]